MMPQRFSEESLLYARWRQGEEKALRMLIERSQRAVYPSVLDLASVDPDTAYQMTVDIFVETLRKNVNGSWMTALLRQMLEICRNKKVSSFPDWDFPGLPAHRRPSFKILKESFQALSFDDKSLLLLRDRLHMPFEEIKDVMDRPADELKHQTWQARARLRDKMEEAIARLRKKL